MVAQKKKIRLGNSYNSAPVVGYIRGEMFLGFQIGLRKQFSAKFFIENIVSENAPTIEMKNLDSRDGYTNEITLHNGFNSEKEKEDILFKSIQLHRALSFFVSQLENVKNSPGFVIFKLNRSGYHSGEVRIISSVRNIVLVVSDCSYSVKINIKRAQDNTKDKEAKSFVNGVLDELDSFIDHYIQILNQSGRTAAVKRIKKETEKKFYTFIPVLYP